MTITDDAMTQAIMSAAAQLGLAIQHSADSKQNKINEKLRHSMAWLNGAIRLLVEEEQP